MFLLFTVVGCVGLVGLGVCLAWLHRLTDPDLAIRRREAMLDALAKLPANPDTDWPIRTGGRRTCQ